MSIAKKLSISAAAGLATVLLSTAGFAVELTPISITKPIDRSSPTMFASSLYSLFAGLIF